MIIQKPPLPRKPRPIIIIGAGGIVWNAHVPAYKKAGFPVAGLYDLNQARAASFAREFGITRAFPSLEAAIKEAPPEVVFDIAVPASAILDILPHLPDRCAVLLQKPMGENLEAARRIRDICRQKRFCAAVNFQLRFAPAILAARSMIDQGYLGQVVDLDCRFTIYTPWHLWRFLEQSPRVEILYHSIHYLDLIRAFLGDPKGVYAKSVRHPKAPRLASTRSSIIVDYGDTIRATVTVDHHHEFGRRHQESYIKWEGTAGAIKAELGVLLNYPEGEPDSLECCRLEVGRAPIWESLKLEGNWFSDAFIGTMGSLQAFVEGSIDPLPTSVEDAFHTMALVEAAYQSSDSGSTPIPL